MMSRRPDRPGAFHAGLGGLLCFVMFVMFVMATAASAGDWPQILGPTRDGVAAADERLADRWPDGGPPVAWRREVGSGHAGLAVVGSRGFLFHRLGDREVVEAIDPATGATLWKDGHPTTFSPQVGGGDGPLCVPLVDGDRVITYGAQGILSCHDVTSGRRLWQRETHRDFEAQEGYFGAGSSPIVVGGHVIVNVGGSRKEAGVVAFALATGETVWTRSGEPASYSSPVAVELDGRPHAVFVTRYRCMLLDAVDGTLRWEFPFGMRGPTVNAASPVVTPSPDRAPTLLVTAAYGVGSVRGTFDASAFTPSWEGAESLATQYCTPILVDGHLYVIDGRDDVPPADLKCVDAATGRVRWIERNFGYGTLLAADGKLVAAKTDGEIVLFRPKTEGLEVLARHRPLTGTLRPLPALAGGSLYLRDESTLLRLDLGVR